MEHKGEPMNHNVKLALVWTAVETASQSVRSGDILSGYLFLLSNSTSTVGYIQGINGVLQLLSALPAGWLADRFRCDRTLVLAAGFGTLGGICLAVALLLQLPIAAYFLAMAAIGLYRGCYSPPLETIFADSVRTGNSALYTWKHISQQLASICGPLLSIAIFALAGDKWELEPCRLVLLFGLVVMIPSVVLLCFFDDSKTLGAGSDPVLSSQRGRGSTVSLPSLASEGDLLPKPADAGGCSRCLESCTPGLVIPILITFSDLISAFAAGMTVKFFSLFFMVACGLPPIYVSIIGAVSPLGISLASIFAQRTSRWLGRVQVGLITRVLDIALLVSMAYLPTAPGNMRLVLACIHLLRTSCANCTKPLFRSVLMDFSSKQRRGLINSLDSIKTFSWSGSAALGGMLIDVFGFQHTFLITAAMKLLAYLPLCPLLFFVEDGVCTCGRRDPDLEAHALAVPLLADTGRSDRGSAAQVTAPMQGPLSRDPAACEPDALTPLLKATSGHGDSAWAAEAPALSTSVLGEDEHKLQSGRQSSRWGTEAAASGQGAGVDGGSIGPVGTSGGLQDGEAGGVVGQGGWPGICSTGIAINAADGGTSGALGRSHTAASSSIGSGVKSNGAGVDIPSSSQKEGQIVGSIRSWVESPVESMISLVEENEAALSAGDTPAL